MNLNLYGHAGQWLLVDCGVTFERSPQNPAVNRVEMPDPVFISNRAPAIAGIIATHAHEDHIGALPYLWEQLRCPIYTTPFTRNVLSGKFRQFAVDAPVITVNSEETLRIGAFEVSWIPITHSTPETHALLISTPVARVLHTADWKLDSAPIVGQAINPEAYQRVGRLGLDAVICDSTNATREGSSSSESELFAGLKDLVQDSRGRVIVGCFASNVARLQTLGNVAHVTGRYVGLLGRSLHRMVGCAKAAGYLAENFNPVSSEDLGYLLPEETLLIATGSQGEQGAALSRLAGGSHKNLELGSDDHVIFSATTIPGNEESVSALVANLQARQLRVTHADDYPRPIHASGHPCADELRQMYRWLRPRLAIPVHGEARHMQRNAQLARESGVAMQLCGENGDLFDVVAGRKVANAAPTGRLWFDEAKGQLQKVQ